jgi:hemin uptake protein HemP
MTERPFPSAPDKDNRCADERSDAPRRVPLSRILGNDREIIIAFNGADYHLRITRNQKLILTK